jgi:hypothetical protein
MKLVETVFFCFCILMLFSNCSDKNEPEKPSVGNGLITAVSDTDQQIQSVEIDNEKYTIHLVFKDEYLPDHVTLHFTLKEGAELLQSEEKQIWDLTISKRVEIKYEGKVYSYIISADYNAPDVPGPLGVLINQIELSTDQVDTIMLDEKKSEILIVFSRGFYPASVITNISLNEGVSFVSPTSASKQYDFTSGGIQWKVKKGNVITTYKVIADYNIDPDPEELGWLLCNNFGELPDYIQVYKAPDILEGSKCIAYIAVANTRKVTFNVLGEAQMEVRKTLSEMYDEQSKKPVIILNGGYFDGPSTWSLSLIARNGKTIAGNVAEIRSNGYTYYPTMGAFGCTKDGKYSARWVFSSGPIQSYTKPSPNVRGEVPQPWPNEEFPAGYEPWELQTGIGGGPILIKDGIVQNIANSYKYEFHDDKGYTNPAPHSMIGITKSKRLIFFVSEGRNMTPGVAGFKDTQMPLIMKSLGCQDAMNLDGGGSSCMLVNGKETIKGSDGHQRKVQSAVVMY